MKNPEWFKILSAIECADATYKPIADPLVFSRARGSMVYDADDKPFIDFCGGFGVLALGHHHASFSETLAAYASGAAPLPVVHGMGDVYPSTAKISLENTLLKTIRATAPHLDRVLLTITGGQAVEAALKTAFLTTQKTGVVAFQGSYHGLDFGALNVTWREDFRQPFLPWLPNTEVLWLPWGCGERDLQKEITRFGADRIAAILVEPIQGRGGVRIPDPGWLATLKAVADQHSALLVFDEVMTGLGRTGQLTFAGKVPADLVCFGKALGGGFPLSAVLGTEKAMGGWPKSRGEALHTGTFFGHPLSCAVGERTLREIVQQKLPERAAQLGERVLQHLNSAWRGYKLVNDIRGMGLMLAVEFSRDGVGAEIMDLARAAGVIVLPSGDRGRCLSFTPALNIAEDMLFDGLNRLEKILRKM